MNEAARLTGINVFLPAYLDRPIIQRLNLPGDPALVIVSRRWRRQKRNTG
jgi:hypothetical protein